MKASSPQVLLRMKENEIEYLHKEIGCLRNELQFLNTVLTHTTLLVGVQRHILTSANQMDTTKLLRHLELQLSAYQRLHWAKH